MGKLIGGIVAVRIFTFTDVARSQFLDFPSFIHRRSCEIIPNRTCSMPTHDKNACLLTVVH